LKTRVGKVKKCFKIYYFKNNINNKMLFMLQNKYYTQKIVQYFSAIPSVDSFWVNGYFDYRNLVELGNENTAKFHVSILADIAVFTLSEHTDWNHNRGFLIALNRQKKVVVLKYCEKIFYAAAPECDKTKEVTKV